MLPRQQPLPRQAYQSIGELSHCNEHLLFLQMTSHSFCSISFCAFAFYALDRHVRAGQSFVTEMLSEVWRVCHMFT